MVRNIRVGDYVIIKIHDRQDFFINFTAGNNITITDSPNVFRILDDNKNTESGAELISAKYEAGGSNESKFHLAKATDFGSLINAGGSVECGVKSPPYLSITSSGSKNFAIQTVTNVEAEEPVPYTSIIHIRGPASGGTNYWRSCPGTSRVIWSDQGQADNDGASDILVMRMYLVSSWTCSGSICTYDLACDGDIAMCPSTVTNETSTCYSDICSACTNSGHADAGNVGCCSSVDYDGKCVACLPLGTDTTNKDVCCTKWEINGVCACVPDEQMCLSGIALDCCSGCKTSGDICKKCEPVDGSCKVTEECAIGGQCNTNTGKCVTLDSLNNGFVCRGDVECSSGYCNDMLAIPLCADDKRTYMVENSVCVPVPCASGSGPGCFESKSICDAYLTGDLMTYSIVDGVVCIITECALGTNKNCFSSKPTCETALKNLLPDGDDCSEDIQCVSGVCDSDMDVCVPEKRKFNKKIFIPVITAIVVIVIIILYLLLSRPK
jgi:hypothetical protein